MTFYNWEELSKADNMATEMLIDGKGIFSHKVLDIDANTTVNVSHLRELKYCYKSAFEMFRFSEVSYLPKQRFSNLGVFSRTEIPAKELVNVDGFLGHIPPEDFDNEDDVSIRKTSTDNLMMRPLSFVNSSCVPNCIYVQLGSKLFLRSLRSISVGDEITVKYSGDYFGKDNIDCLCPHPEAHGHGIVVLQSRTRAKAKTSGESGKFVSNCLNGKRQSRSLRKSLGKTAKQAQTSKRVDNLSGRLHSSTGRQFRSMAIENFGGNWDWKNRLRLLLF